MLLYDCSSIEFILLIVAKVLYYVKIIIPVILIVLIVFDLSKVLVGNADEKEKREATSKAVKRIIYAIIIFLVPTIVTFLFNMISKSAIKNGTPTSWVGCWSVIRENQK